MEQEPMIRIDLPHDLEVRLRGDWHDVDQAAKEALLLQAFREGKLTHYELSQALGLNRWETNALLARHHLYEGSVTFDDLEADRKTLERVLGPVR